MSTRQIESWLVTDRAAWLARRQQDVTASSAAALLGVHEWISRYELYALKSGLISEDPEESKAMQRGRLLEPVALQLLQERNPEIRFDNPATYYRDPAIRLGATPDALAYCPERGLGVVQIKSVEPSVYRRKWLVDGVVEPPIWIAIQALIEAHLTGASWAAVAPLRVGFGLDIDLIDVPLKPELMTTIEREVVAFWVDVQCKHAPSPDPEKDGNLIERFFAPGGPPISLAGSNHVVALVDEREALSTAKAAADKRLKVIKSELLLALGGATAGRLDDGRLITSNQVHRKAYSVEASSYIDLRVKQAVSR